jgi:uncharacterized protein YbjT (DUF2867 family)
MSRRILVLGGTGMLGRPVVHCLTDKGHAVRILTRSAEKTRNLFGDTVDIVEGTATNRDDIRAALTGCDAAHINLTPASEFAATRNVLELAKDQLERITYVSATTLSEENRWFDRKLIAYLDVAGEHGDPSEANALYGAPAITLDEWFKMPKDSRTGMPH